MDGQGRDERGGGVPTVRVCAACPAGGRSVVVDDARGRPPLIAGEGPGGRGVGGDELRNHGVGSNAVGGRRNDPWAAGSAIAGRGSAAPACACEGRRRRVPCAFPTSGRRTVAPH
eukprot:374583-Heterocapsa_arctica.AAC.1